jgi:hypothetical protein
MMNYKPTSSNGEKLTTQQDGCFPEGKQEEGDVYDDIMYYDDAKELVFRQSFLIAKGYSDPKGYFQAIRIENWDDRTFDDKIGDMVH